MTIFGIIENKKEVPIRYTQKQIDKFHRQKYITELEKISKNLFRMFKDPTIESQTFCTKFTLLYDKLQEKEQIQLNSEYHLELKAYINRLYSQTSQNKDFSNACLNNIKEAEMSNLNRLQKLKNGLNYKKNKHKGKDKNEDWG